MRISNEEGGGGGGGGRPPGGLPEAPACPFCDGVHTELVSAFGAHASVASYWCRDCRSPFELMRWLGPRRRAGERPAGDGARDGRG